MSDGTILDLEAELAKYDPSAEPEEVEATSVADDDVEEAEPEEVEVEAKEDGDEEPKEPETKDDDDDLEERVRRLHIEAREAKRAAQKAQQEAEYARGQREMPKDEAVIREAAIMAEQIAKVNDWNKTCDRIGEEGKANFKDFDKVVASYKENFPEYGGVPSVLIEGAMEAAPGKEAAIIHYLGKNLDVAEHILSLSPVKAGAAMAKLADKVSKPKAVSKAPAPVTPVAGGNADSKNRSGYYEGMSEAQFFKMEAKLRKEQGYSR